MSRNCDISPAFYVVQFLELPFEDIDDYVCVPKTWLIGYKGRDHWDQRAKVPYPKDENPFDTRDRVERKERYDDKWRHYSASVKYESNTFWDAELWIATRNEYGPLVNEVSKITDTQPKMSSKRSALTEPMKELGRKRLKLDKAAQSSSVSNCTVNDANAEPGCSENQQLIIIEDNLMECPQIEVTFASHTESRSSQRTDKSNGQGICINDLSSILPKLLNSLQLGSSTTRNSCLPNEQQANQNESVFVIESPQNVIDISCQRVECMEEELLSPYYDNPSDSDGWTD